MDSKTNPTTEVLINGENLSIDQVIAVARNGIQTKFDKLARTRVSESEKKLQEITSSEKPIYGVNTGLGFFANRRIHRDHSPQLSRNLVLSHAVGLGDPYPEEVVRAAMLIRANTLAKGFSGIRPVLIDTLLEMLNRRVTPLIPSQGSLGSSGDLAPLAHLALVFCQDPEESRDSPSGKAWYQGQLLNGGEAMQASGISRVILRGKEGLALINGATFANALACLASFDAARLLHLAEISTSLTLEALLAVTSAFDPRLHQVRPHPGQISVASRILELIAGSTLVDSTDRVQDAYSLRCSPQVMGPATDLLGFVNGIINRELNSATDNPLLFDSVALSGGNFHGEPIGLASDYLKIALAEVGAISERRIFRLTAGHTNEGLPPMLVMNPDHAGLESGLMMLQYSAASLVLENQALASPASVLSLPTSAGQEDHNANATMAARQLSKVVRNLRQILAIELLTSAQAITIRLQNNPQTKLGIGTMAAYQWIRSHFPPREDDSPLSDDILAMAELLKSNKLVNAVDEALRTG